MCERWLAHGLCVHALFIHLAPGLLVFLHLRQTVSSPRSYPLGMMTQSYWLYSLMYLCSHVCMHIRFFFFSESQNLYKKMENSAKSVADVPSDSQNPSPHSPLKPRVVACMKLLTVWPAGFSSPWANRFSSLGQPMVQWVHEFSIHTHAHLATAMIDH